MRILTYITKISARIAISLMFAVLSYAAGASTDVIISRWNWFLFLFHVLVWYAALTYVVLPLVSLYFRITRETPIPHKSDVSGEHEGEIECPECNGTGLWAHPNTRVDIFRTDRCPKCGGRGLIKPTERQEESK